MSQQLILDLPTRTAMDRGDFFVSSSNAMALALVEDWKNWPEKRHILTGPKASGKTHLVYVWATQSSATVIEAKTLTTMDIETLSNKPLAIEDVDLICGDTDKEQAMFHLYNLCASKRNPLLLTGKGHPNHWPISLPDLQSRLMSLQHSELKLPDDALFAALLAKLFSDRQLFPPPDIFTYLSKHAERSFEFAKQIVDLVDKQSLAEKRAITRSFVSKILSEHTLPHDYDKS